MKKISCLAFLIIALNGFAQNLTLTAQHKKSGRTVPINLNRKVRLYTKHGENIFGRVTDIKEQSFVINNQTVLLIDILEIQGIKASKGTWGAIWTIVGSMMVIVN